MTAKIVQNNLNTVFAKSFYQYLKSTSNDDTFYAAVAYVPRSEWSTYAGADGDTTEFAGGSSVGFDFQDSVFYSQNTISLHKIYTGGVSRVVPRIDWKEDTIYDAWNTDKSSYVLVKEFSAGVAKLNVYACLFSPRTASTYSPSGTSVTPIYLSDGYTWKYLYTISNADAIRFLNDSWMPVPERVTETEASTITTGTSRYSLYSVQQAAELGTIYDVIIDSDTFDFTSVTSGLNIAAVDKSSNRPSKKFKATISKSGYNTVLSLTQHGLGYNSPIEIINEADSEVVAGITAIPSPGVGFGFDVPYELKANSVMVIARNSPDGSLLPLVNDNTFNLVNLVRNPIDKVTGLYGEDNFYIACRSFTTTSATFAVGDTLKVGSQTKRATVVGVDGTTVYYLNYKKDEEANLFTVGETVGTEDGTKNTTITSVSDRAVRFNSGDVLMVDWKATDLTRSQDQIETFSFVLNFE